MPYTPRPRSFVQQPISHHIHPQPWQNLDIFEFSHHSRSREFHGFHPHPFQQSRFFKHESPTYQHANLALYSTILSSPPLLAPISSPQCHQCLFTNEAPRGFQRSASNSLKDSLPKVCSVIPHKHMVSNEHLGIPVDPVSRSSSSQLNSKHLIYGANKADYMNNQKAVTLSLPTVTTPSSSTFSRLDKRLSVESDYTDSIRHRCQHRPLHLRACSDPSSLPQLQSRVPPSLATHNRGDISLEDLAAREGRCLNPRSLMKLDLKSLDSLDLQYTEHPVAGDTTLSHPCMKVKRKRGRRGRGRQVLTDAQNHST